MKDYRLEDNRKALACELAEESMVLLKNNNQCLPLGAGTAAFFGRAYYKPNLGGMGSGASTKEIEIRTIDSECEKMGIVPAAELHTFYKNILDCEKEDNMIQEIMELTASGVDLVASGMVYEIFGRYRKQPEEPKIPEELLTQTAEQTDTAILVFGRNTGGEECDRRIENDFTLLQSERELIEAVCKNFQKVVLLLNINGLVDLSWIAMYPSIEAVLYMGLPGEQGPSATAKILAGKITPSGKLAFTVAKSYEAYPTAQHFSFNKEQPDSILDYKHYGLDAEKNGSSGFEKSPVTLYSEGIYMGYRYFDTFGKSVIYPYGYGLSYTSFSIEDITVAKDGENMIVGTTITNCGDIYSGKETLQVYGSAPEGKLEKPYQSYLGCIKTSLLAPGEQEKVSLTIPMQNLASYDEESAAWILEPGNYYIRVGANSRNTHIAGGFYSEETIVCEQLCNRIPIQKVNLGKIEFLSARGRKAISYEGEKKEMENTACQPIAKSDIRCKFPVPTAGVAPVEPVNSKLIDVKNKAVTMEQFLSQMSVEELAVLVNGFGPGLPFGGMGAEISPTIQYVDGSDIAVNTHKSGMMGYVSAALLKYGIPSAFYKDGPASVGMTAWPTGMILACSFNTDLFYAFGAACACEAEQLDVDSWLAPALNLHRNPIGGRNFEYFSEDPIAAGICGLHICKGVSETTQVTACPKHFALNEQETYRRGCTRKSIDAVDTIVSEQAAREIYLKPFEMVIRNCQVTTLMTSFNKINGIFAGESYDLCTEILRNEWGYSGVVVTDWGDMDVVIDGANAVSAGNDVIMPGGPPVIAQILQGYEEGRVDRKKLMEAAANLLSFVMHSRSFEEWQKDHTTYS